MSRRSRLVARPRLEQLDSRLVLSALTPAQIEAAYGLNAITFTSNGKTVTGNGAGQTIAIVDAYNDPYIATELATFDAKYGLPAANLAVDDLGSPYSVDAGWAQEEALDVEAAHLAAPGANIVLVEARSDSTSDLMNAVAAANSYKFALGGIQFPVTVVSMSWGGSDTYSETSYDSVFNHANITYLAASGDEGAGAEWPADSPYVVGVGGTSLVATTAGRVSEVAWADSSGGTSRVETEPSYQDKAQTTGMRTSPDVSAVADPNTGIMVYSVLNEGWEQVGGTSLATPIWAGLVAIADQGRILAGKLTLSSSQTLGDLYNAPSGSFYDVTSGPRATTSYDTSTGLGTPNAKVLVAALVADPGSGSSTTGNGVGGDPLPTTTTTGTGTTTTGGGTTTQPRYPWWPPFGGFGGFGFALTGTGGTWSGPSVPRNAGQGSTNSFTPIIPLRGYRSSTPILPPATQANHPSQPVPSSPGAIDAVLDDWGDF